MKRARRRAGPLILVATSWILLGGATPSPTSIEAFDETVLTINEDCRTIASTECIDRAWRIADADGDGGLSLGELEQLHLLLDAWAAWKRPDLPSHASTAILNGSKLVTAIGLGRLLAAFDANRDGRLTRDEAFSEIRLDRRPLAAVLSDPDSVDRATLSRRLAAASPLLAALIASAPLHQP